MPQSHIHESLLPPGQMETHLDQDHKVDVPRTTGLTAEQWYSDLVAIHHEAHQQMRTRGDALREWLAVRLIDLGARLMRAHMVQSSSRDPFGNAFDLDLPAPGSDEEAALAARIMGFGPGGAREHEAVEPFADAFPFEQAWPTLDPDLLAEFRLLDHSGCGDGGEDHYCIHAADFAERQLARDLEREANPLHMIDGDGMPVETPDFRRMTNTWGTRPEVEEPPGLYKVEREGAFADPNNWAALDAHRAAVRHPSRVNQMSDHLLDHGKAPAGAGGSLFDWLAANDLVHAQAHEQEQTHFDVPGSEPVTEEQAQKDWPPF